RLGAEALGVGMGVSFMSEVFDPSRLHSIRESLSDTWNSSKNIDRNKTIIGQNLGRFAFDTGLTMFGALGGSLVGRKLCWWEEVKSRCPVSELESLKLSSRNLESVPLETLSGGPNLPAAEAGLSASPDIQIRIVEKPDRTWTAPARNIQGVESANRVDDIRHPEHLVRADSFAEVAEARADGKSLSWNDIAE